MQKRKAPIGKGKDQVRKVAAKVAAAMRPVLQRAAVGNRLQKRSRMPDTGRLGLSAGPSGSTNRKRQVIEEDEYIGEIFGSVAFVSTGYPVNPGQAATFPWASKLFSLYEEYEFTHLEFYYKREVSEYATNGQTGKVIFSFDYDATDPAPTTKQQVEDTYSHVDFMPCTPFASIRADPLMLKKSLARFVRIGPQAVGTDLKTYDVANFYVSTSGCASNAAIGELRVRYRCIAREPILLSSSVFATAAHIQIQPVTSGLLTGAGLMPGYTPSLGGLRTPTLQTLVFPAGVAGNYSLFLGVATTGSSGVLGGFSFSAGCTGLSLCSSSTGFDTTSNFYSYANTGGAPYDLCQFATVSISATGGTITWGTGSITGTAYGDIFISLLPSTLVAAEAPVGLEDRMKRFEAFMSGNPPPALDIGPACKGRPIGCHEVCSAVPSRILEEQKADLDDIEDLHLSETLMRLARARGFKDLRGSVSSPGVIVQYEPSAAPSK
jgi:hypothetical protein